MTGIITLGGEQLRVTQNGVTVGKITFGVDYFTTDKTYTYDIRLKNTEQVGGSNSKYLRWQWTAIIDGVEENINQYINVKDNSETTNKQAYITGDWFYLVDNDYIATKLSPQEDIPILETLKFKGTYNTDTREYGSVLDKYYSGSNIQIYLTVQGSTDDIESDGIDDDAWEIARPQAIIYDHLGNEIYKTEEFGEYTIPEDIGIEKSIVTEEGETIYFQGFQITNEETGNDGGTIFYPGDTVTLQKFDKLIPVYGQDEDYGDLIFTLDDNTGTYTVKGANGSVTSIDIPTLYAGDKVTVIESKGFYNYTSLQTVTLGQRITKISSGAFDGCTSLVSVDIPDTVISIMDNAFSNCSSLESVNFSENSQLRFIGGGTSSTYMSYGAFYNCVALTSITIPNGVTKISAGAFADCANLTTVNISKDAKLQTILPGAFWNCDSLTSITIPENVTSIGNYAFGGCGNVTEINYYAKAVTDFASDSGVFDHAGYNTDGLTFIVHNTVSTLPAYLCRYSTVTANSANINKVIFENFDL